MFKNSKKLFLQILLTIPNIVGLSIYIIKCRNNMKPHVSLSLKSLIISLILFIFQCCCITIDIFQNFNNDDDDIIDDLKNLIGYLKLPCIFIPIWINHQQYKEIYEKLIDSFMMLRHLQHNNNSLKQIYFLLKWLIPMIIIYMIAIFVPAYIDREFDYKGHPIVDDDNKNIIYYGARYMPHICGMLVIVQLILKLACVHELIDVIDATLREIKKRQ